MSRQNLAIGLLFLLALGLWRWFDQGGDDQLADRHTIYPPNYKVRNLYSRHYDASGRLREELTADFAEHFEQLEMTDLDRPRITTRDEQSHPVWLLSGEKGILNTNDNAILRNQVVLKNLAPNPVVEYISTDYLEMDMTNQQIRTNLPVKIDGPDMHSQGVGLLGKLDKNSYELLEDSHAIYFNLPR